LSTVETGFELCVLKGEDKGKVIPLRYREVHLGRKSVSADPNWVHFAEPTVSRHHASLLWDDQTRHYTIYHKSRTNPTIVNNRKVKEHIVLNHDDVIQLGVLVFRVNFKGTVSEMSPGARALMSSSRPSPPPPPPPPAFTPPTPAPSRRAARLDSVDDSDSIVSGMKLVVTEGPDRGSVFVLDKAVLFIGRRDNVEDTRGANGILLNDEALPREQVLLAWNEREHTYGIFQNESTHVTTRIHRMVSGRSETLQLAANMQALLKLNDVIRLADTSLRLCSEEEANAEYEFEIEDNHLSGLQPSARDFDANPAVAKPTVPVHVPDELKQRYTRGAVRGLEGMGGNSDVLDDLAHERRPPASPRNAPPPRPAPPAPTPAPVSAVPRTPEPAPAVRRTEAPAPPPQARPADAPATLMPPFNPQSSSTGFSMPPPRAKAPEPPPSPAPPPGEELSRGFGDIKFPTIDLDFVRNLPTRPVASAEPRAATPVFEPPLPSGPVAPAKSMGPTPAGVLETPRPLTDAEARRAERIPLEPQIRKPLPPASSSDYTPASEPGLPRNYRPPELQGDEDDKHEPVDFREATFTWNYRADYIISFLEGRNKGQRVELLTRELEEGRHITVGARGERFNEIEIDDLGVVNQQATITYRGGRFTLLNEGKDESIFVNQLAMRQGEELLLKTGDHIAMGESVLIFLERSVVQVLSKYELTVVTGVPEDKNRTFDLLKEVVVIGRLKSCDIALFDTEISRKHLAITLRGGRFYLTHLSSSNPTFINGISLPRGRDRMLNEGDKVQLSDHTTLLFRLRPPAPPRPRK
jgi:pSer/pThr/pTyr-binding forkhead associated (FHA) protein